MFFFRFFVYCTGKQGDEWSPTDVVDKQGAVFFSDGMQDPESLIVAMERVTLLFERSIVIRRLKASFGAPLSVLWRTQSGVCLSRTNAIFFVNVNFHESNVE